MPASVRPSRCPASLKMDAAAGSPGVGGGPQGGDSRLRPDHAAIATRADEGRLADDRLEASGVAAAAERAVFENGRVPDLAGAAARAAEYDPVDHDAGAHTGTDRDDEEAVVPASDAVEALGHGERVHVVLDDDGQVERAPQGLADGNLVPAELGRIDDAVALPVDGTRDADPDAEHADGGAAGDEALEQGRQVGEEGRRGRVERLARGAHHRSVESDLDERDVVGDDLDADGATGAGGEPQHPGGPSALRGRVLELDDEAVGEQILRELRHEGG